MPVQLQRAMAAEAEAAREARAKVVAAEGEQKASLHLKEAALVLEESTSALQLRYLQVLLCIIYILGFSIDNTIGYYIEAILEAILETIP